MKKLLSTVLVAAILFSFVLSGCVFSQTEENLTSQTDADSEILPDDDDSVEFVPSGNPIVSKTGGDNEVSTCPLTEDVISTLVGEAEYTISQSPEFSGTVLVSVGNRIVFEKSYGYADDKGKVPNENNTYYQVGSITKQFTGTAFLILERQGKVKNSDTLDKFFPDYSKKYDYLKSVTIGQLLEMTAGMGDYMTVIENDEDTLKKYYNAAKKSEDDAKNFIVNTIFEEGLYTDPGEVYSYSNSSYYLLGVILEQITGMSYRDFLQQTFFDPAGMTDTYFGGDGKESQIGYSYAQDKYISDKDDKYLTVEADYPYLFSAGSVVSTVEDLNKWLDMIISGKIITEDDCKKVESGLYLYDYGWNTSDFCWHHSGRTYTYSSQIFMDYRTDVKVVVLTNISFYDTLSELTFNIFNPVNYQVKLSKGMDVNIDKTSTDTSK